MPRWSDCCCARASSAAHPSNSARAGRRAMAERRDGAPDDQGEAERRELPTVADTEALGRELAAELRPGDLVVLDGPLGAGKTALTRGIAAGLGVEGRVSSPTFIIARQHRAGAAPGS